MRPKVDQAEEQEDGSTAEMNMRYGMQRRHLQQPQTREKDREEQDEFGVQPPPKDRQKHNICDGNAARVRETGPPDGGVRSAVALLESGRADRTRKPGCTDRGA